LQSQQPFIDKDDIKEETVEEPLENEIEPELEPEPEPKPEPSASPLPGSSATSVEPTPNQETASVEACRFLTLEDVQGTGYGGRELYRCGVDSCPHSSETAEELRQHMQQCSPNEEDGGDSSLYCVHCGSSSKRFSKPSFFIDHLRTHGLKRFCCAVCNARFAVQSQAQSHLRAKHKYVSSRIVPADPSNPSPLGLFYVHPMVSIQLLVITTMCEAHRRLLCE
jgi:hypothetical protein